MDSNKELWNLSLHDKSLRDLKFNDAGTRKYFARHINVVNSQSANFLDRDPDLFTVSSDRALKVTDVETSKSFFEVDKAHKYAVHSSN